MERNENVEKLLKTAEKLGFNKDVQEQIKEHMSQGLGAFKVYESLQMGHDKVDYQLNFSPGKKADDPNVYLNSIDVLLDKAVMVPHKTVMGLDTREVENLIQNRPHESMVNPFNKEQFSQLEFVHDAKVDEKMTFLADHAPDVFNALYIKYKPETSVALTPAMIEQQTTMLEGLVKYNSFSTYYNLTKLELYNVMDGGAAYKTLFKVSKPDEQTAGQESKEQPDNRYKSWVMMDPNNKRADGSFEMQLFHENRNFNVREVLSHYNFKETNDRFSRQDVTRFMEKGSKIKLTNLGEEGEKEVLVRANPKYMGIDMFKLTGEPIRYQEKYYKNQLVPEVGAFVELKMANDLNISRPAQESISKQKASEKAQLFEIARTNSHTGDQKKTSGQAKDNKLLETKETNANVHKENAPSTGSIKTVTRKKLNGDRLVQEDGPKQGISR